MGPSWIITGGPILQPTMGHPASALFAKEGNSIEAEGHQSSASDFIICTV